MKSDKIDTPSLILIIILMMALINTLMGCKSAYPVSKAPTRREINRAMKNTPWEYNNVKTTIYNVSIR